MPEKISGVTWKITNRREALCRETNRSMASRRKLLFRFISNLAGRADVGNMNHAGAAVEVAINLDLLAYELLRFILVIQLVVRIGGL